MSDTIKVSELPNAVTPLAGDELLMIVQSGTSRRCTADDIATLVTLDALLPTQGGHSGEFLTTNGSNTSWASAGGGATTGNWSANFVGFVTVPTTATINYVIANGLCTLFLSSDVLDTGDGSGVITIDNLPVPVRPASDRAADCLVTNVLFRNIPGSATISNAGTIDLRALSLTAIPPTLNTDLADDVVFTGDCGLRAGWTLLYPL
jgi:hypothetical protein